MACGVLRLRQASLSFATRPGRLWLVVALTCGAVALGRAQRAVHAQDSVALAELRAAFDAIEANLQAGERDDQGDAYAVAETREVLDRGFDPDNARTSAEVVLGAIRVATRLGRPSALLADLGERAYAYAPRDTVQNHLAMYVLSLGVLEITRNNHTAAKTLLDSVMTFDEAEMTPYTLGRAAYLRGYILYYREDFEAAISYFAKSAKHYGRSPEWGHFAVNAYDATASTNFELGHYAEALTYAERAVAALEALEDERVADDMPEAFNIFLNYAEALHANGRALEAYDAALKGLRIASARNDVSKIARCRLILGGLHLADEHFGQADQYLTFALAALRERGEHYLVIRTLAKLVDLRKRQRRLDEALVLLDRKWSLKDSLTRASQAESVETLVQSHEAEKVEQEVAVLRAEATGLAAVNDRKRFEQYALALALLLALGGAGVILLRLRERKRSNEQLEGMVAVRTQELREQTEHLRQSNGELERFAYIASHDLKTPLRNVTSFLNLIERRLAPEAKVQVAEYLAIALANARQMHHLVTDVLEFSKINADLTKEAEIFDLADRAREIVRGMQPELARRNARVTVEGQASLTAPLSHIAQLVTNLIENGVKYNASPVPTVEVAVRVDGVFVEVRICDNGIGIAPEYHAHVFELFRRLHTADTYDGTGVGLAVCKKVVERLGGSVALESAAGRGSTFTVRLPADCRQVQRPIDLGDAARREVVLEGAAAN